MKIERFEDIEAWKEARKLVNTVYGITNNWGIYHGFRFKKPYPSLICFCDVEYQRRFR